MDLGVMVQWKLSSSPFVSPPVLFSEPVTSSLSTDMSRQMISILSSFHPLCFGWDWGQSSVTEFARLNIHCLFHKNWHKAPCLLCINKNVVKSVSLLEFFLFQIFVKYFTVFSFSGQCCVLDVFGFPCHFSAFHNFCFRTIVVSFFLSPRWHMLLFYF